MRELRSVRGIGTLAESGPDSALGYDPNAATHTNARAAIEPRTDLILLAGALNRFKLFRGRFIGADNDVSAA